MPKHMPNDMVRCTATKSITHGLPAKENGYVGIAIKTQAVAAGAGSGAPQKTIANLEPFSMLIHGVVEVPNTDAGISALLKGAPVYVTDATGVLVTAAGGGISKFGTVYDRALERGLPSNRIRVDLDGKMFF